VGESESDCVRVRERDRESRSVVCCEGRSYCRFHVVKRQEDMHRRLG
jgi:hypothetical protein